MVGTDRVGHQGEGVETVRLYYPRSGESIETLLLLGPPGSLELHWTELESISSNVADLLEVRSYILNIIITTPSDVLFPHIQHRTECDLRQGEYFAVKRNDYAENTGTNVEI